MSRAKREILRLPTSKPDKPYEGEVVFIEEDMTDDRQGFAWAIVIMVDTPPTLKGLMTTDTILLDTTNPDSFGAAAKQLGTYGLDSKDLWEGNIRKLLIGKRIRFHYRKAKPPERMLPTITIIKILGTKGGKE